MRRRPSNDTNPTGGRGVTETDLESVTDPAGGRDVTETDLGSVTVPAEEPPRNPDMSTPLRGLAVNLETVHSPVLVRMDEMGRLRRRVARRLNISTEGRLDLPEEPNARTEAKWKQILADLLRYIDDEFGLSKVNFENSFGFEVNDVFHRIKHSVQSQNVFRHLVRAAEEIGMVVNSRKTSMICISDALSYKAEAYILDADGERIGCQERIKALGMYFSGRPNMDAQVASISQRIRSRYWTLRNLKNSDFSMEELVAIYKTCLLYTSPSPRDRQKSRMPSSA